VGGGLGGSTLVVVVPASPCLDHLPCLGGTFVRRTPVRAYRGSLMMLSRTHLSLY